jgi:hypothetical protein
MARFFPAIIPVQLAAQPALIGEKRVWEALRAAPLSPDTLVFYNRAAKGCRRRSDMLIVNPQRGLIAIEVKNGLVHFYKKSFRQRRASGQGWPRRIDPWGQAKRAVAHTLAALGLHPRSIPQAVMLAVPTMTRAAYTFLPGPHILTAKELAPVPLSLKLDAVLPRLDASARAALAPSLQRIAAALTRSGDEGNPFALPAQTRPAV